MNVYRQGCAGLNALPLKSTVWRYRRDSPLEYYALQCAYFCRWTCVDACPYMSNGLILFWNGMAPPKQCLGAPSKTHTVKPADVPSL
mmetsp:Transcript_12527/g.16877  ORF Transcript_12527/g.16877 Transcript_12527/m.16877 type:complete len:87 (-) Transcript_12527:111-371(-)